MCGKALVVKIDNQSDDHGWVDFLKTTMHPFKDGLIPVEVDYRNQDARSVISLGADWKVTPSDALLASLESSPLVIEVIMKYA